LTDSEFWKSIAEKFRSIFDVSNGMRVKWQCTDGAPKISWEIQNEPGPESKMQFFRLAQIAGRKLQADSPDACHTWMLKLRETRPNQHIDTVTFESSDGTVHITETALILDVLQASANLADELELTSPMAAPEPEATLKRGLPIVQKAAKQVETLLGLNSADLNQAPPIVQLPKEETIGTQIKRLRDECRLTIEELAEAIDSDERTIRRHEADEVVPYARTIRAYEGVFSKRLERKVVISKMS
jgi:DNA-binding XRE family transcriptional regulator